MRLLWLLIGFAGLVISGFITLKAMNIHDPWGSTFGSLFVFISIKLLVSAAWNYIHWVSLRRVFFSIVNFIWLALWLMFRLASYSGLGVSVPSVMDSMPTRQTVFDILRSIIS